MLREVGTALNDSESLADDARASAQVHSRSAAERVARLTPASSTVSASSTSI